MNTRKTAPLIGIVSLVGLLAGGAGAAQARIMVNDAPPVIQGVPFDVAEAIRSAKQAEAGPTSRLSAADAQGVRLSEFAAARAAAAPQAVAFERTEAIRSVKQAEAGAAVRLSPSEAQGVRLQKYAEAQADATEGGQAVDDVLSPLRGDR